MTTTDLVGSKLLKNQVQRARPFQVESLETIQRSPAKGYSFVSNHAGNMFAMSTFISQVVPYTKFILYGLAVLVSYSRIYNGVHFPLDVFVGGLLGFLWGLLYFRAGEALLRKNFINSLLRKRESIS